MINRYKNNDFNKNKMTLKLFHSCGPIISMTYQTQSRYFIPTFFNIFVSKVAVHPAFYLSLHRDIVLWLIGLYLPMYLSIYLAIYLSISRSYDSYL